MVVVSNVTTSSAICSASLGLRTAVRGKVSSPLRPFSEERGPTKNYTLLQGLQLLARLEANRLARRDSHLGAGARVAANAGLAWTDVEDAEAAQFDTLALRQRPLHGFEHSLNSHFGFCFRDAGSVDHFVDNIELDQAPLLIGPSKLHDR